jgi:fumarylacetoacetate (FAA) hydrolase family protein
MYAPIQDRRRGRGFTHQVEDVVTVASPGPPAGQSPTRSDEAPPWSFGVSHLMRNLARRGLI